MIGPGIGTWAGARGPAGGGPLPLLLIVAGQSNAVKAGTAGQTPPAKYSGLAVKVWIEGSGFTDYVVGTNSGDGGTGWGSEAEFAYRYQVTGGGTRPLYVAKRAVGASALAADPAGSDWNPETGELFEQLEDRVTAARAAILALHGAAPEEVTLWNQGEKDRSSDSWAAAYDSNLAAFLAAYRTRISGGLFLIERTRLLATRYPHDWGLRETQIVRALADGNAAVIDADSDTDWAEVHPGPAWCEDLGARCHAAWAGSYDGTYGSILDTVPSAFGFAGLGSQPAATLVTSAAITPTGYQRRTAVTVTGGEYQVLNPDDTPFAGWTSAAGVISKWQKLRVRHTTAAAPDTATVTTLTVGGVAGTFTSTTAATAAVTPAELLTGSGEDGLWLDFTDKTGMLRGDGVTPVTAPGHAIRSLPDKFGLSGAPQRGGAAGTEPTYQEDANGVGHGSFDGSNDYLKLADRFGLGANPNLSVIALLNPQAGNAGNRVATLGGSDSGSATGVLSVGFGGSGGSNAWSFNNGSQSFDATVTGTPQLMIWTRTAGSQYGDGRFHIDGVERTETAASSPTSVPTDTAALCLVGHSGNGGTPLHARMHLYHLIVLNRVVSAAEIAGLAVWAAAVLAP